MSTQPSHPSSLDEHDVLDKSAPGRGAAIIVYALYMGSVMLPVTAVIGVLIAHFLRGRSADWVATHFQFQIRTFWIGLLAVACGLAVWRLLGTFSPSPMAAWTFGYLFFTAGIIWLIGRCGVGIYRITANLPVATPKSWLFGLGS
jgi:uncharacterized membrane protein